MYLSYPLSNFHFLILFFIKLNSVFPIILDFLSDYIFNLSINLLTFSFEFCFAFLYIISFSQFSLERKNCFYSFSKISSTCISENKILVNIFHWGKIVLYICLKKCSFSLRNLDSIERRYMVCLGQLCSISLCLVM